MGKNMKRQAWAGLVFGAIIFMSACGKDQKVEAVVENGTAYYNIDHSFTLDSADSAVLKVTFKLNKQSRQYKDILNKRYDDTLIDCVEKAASGASKEQLLNDPGSLGQLMLESVGERLGYNAVEEVHITQSMLQESLRFE